MPVGGSSHLVSGLVHKWTNPTYPIYNQGCNPLTIRGMNHQVPWCHPWFSPFLFDNNFAKQLSMAFRKRSCTLAGSLFHIPPIGLAKLVYNWVKYSFDGHITLLKATNLWFMVYGIYIYMYI